MKSLKRFLMIVAAAMVLAMPASAQFKYGPRVGMAINSLHFDESAIKSSNCTGFMGGIEAELTVPFVGLAIDGSLMYVRRSSEIKEGNEVIKNNCDYFDIPIYLKWKFGLPIVGKLVTPYVFTGPDFAFLASKKAVGDAFKNKSVDTSWNFGLGVELVNHLQISASYGFGLNNAINPIDVESAPIEGKTHCWYVTAAWLF